MLHKNLTINTPCRRFVVHGSPFSRNSIFLLMLMLLGGCALTPHKKIKAHREEPAPAKQFQPRPVAAKDNLFPKGEISQHLISVQLTLSSALAIAEKQNPLLQAKRKEVGIAEGNLEQASLRFQNNPELSVGLARRRDLSSGEPGNFTDNSIELSQEFEVWGQPEARRLAAKAAYDVVLAKLEMIKWDVLSQVREEFMNLLFATEQHRLLEDQGRFLETIIQLSERQLKAGDVSKMQYRQMKILIASLQKKVEDSRSKEKTAISMLKFSLGLSPKSKLHLKGNITTLQWNPSKADQILTEILENHPRIRYQRFLIKQVRRELTLVLREAKFNITGSLIYNNNPQDNRTYGVSVSVPIQIFNQRKGDIKASLEAVEVALADMKAVEQNLITEVKIAISRLNSAYKTASLYDVEILSAIQANQKLLEKSFRLGEIGLVDLRLSQRELLDAQREALEVNEDYYTRLALVEGLLGHEIKFP